MAGFGETLRQARAQKGVTLREAEQATRINRHHLAALEDENFAALPPLIYQRGIVRNYAVYLDLDASKMLGVFEAAIGSTVKDPQSSRPLPPPDMPSHWAPNFAIIGFGVVVTAIVFAWVYSIWLAPTDDLADPAATQTPTTITRTQEPARTAPEPPAPPTTVAQPTATIAPVQPTVSGIVAGRQNSTDNQLTHDTAQPAPELTATEPAPAYQTQFAIAATQDVDLHFVVDGELVWDGALAGGNATQLFTGSSFEISVSDGTSIEFINGCGQQTAPTNAQPGTQDWSFQANENSCPVN